MKYTKLFILCLTGLLIISVSCTNDLDLEQPDKSSSIASDEILIEKGHIRIKITTELEKELDADTVRLAQLLDAIRVERTFPYGGKFENRMRKSGLHLWYEVYFDTEGTTLRSNLTSAIKGIQVVEPSYNMIRLDNPQVVGAIAAQSYGASTYSVFNDPLLGKQWHYYNDGSLGSGFKAGADINLFPAWELETGKPEVIVAIIEGGVDYTHPDLAANIWINTDEAQGTTGLDNDNNGYIGDIHGWNFYDDSNIITFTDHSTHVAGTVAAVNNNGIGVAGVAGGNGSPNSGARLMICQIASSEGEFSVGAAMKRAFVYAANNGAVIAQCSWGHPVRTPLPQSDKEAIDYFIDYAGTDENGVVTGPIKGGVAIFAAGNSGTNAPVYPAAMPRVLAVASMAHDYKIPSNSNYGTHIGVVAPGGLNSAPSDALIWSTGVNNRYIPMAGTSMACPHVSGVAALVISRYGVGYPGLTNSMVIDILKESAHDEIYSYNPTYDFLGEKRLGSGYIDAYKALMSVIDLVSIDELSIQWGTTSAKLSWEVPENKYNQKPLKYIILYSTDPLENIDPANIPQSIAQIMIDGGDANVGSKLLAELKGLTKATTYHIGIISEYADGQRSDILSLSGKTGDEGIKLYPNPVDKILHIKVDENISSIELTIYNAAGAKVFSVTISNLSGYSPEAVDISNLSGGTYKVVLNYNGVKEVRNIIKR